MADHDNPFAPGDDGRNPDIAPADSAYEPVDMDVSAILSRAWDLFISNPGIVLGALLLPLIPTVLFQISDFVIQMSLVDADQDTAVLLQLASAGISIVSMLVSLFFQLGMIRIFLQLTRGHHAEIGMLAGEGGNYIGAFVASLLMGLAIFVGFLALVLPGIIVALGLQFALYALVDRNLGPIEALQESWRLTDGYKLTIFGINLVIGFGAILLACFTLGFGYLLAIPVLSLVQAVMYHSLTHIQGRGEVSGLGL